MRKGAHNNMCICVVWTRMYNNNMYRVYKVHTILDGHVCKIMPR